MDKHLVYLIDHLSPYDVPSEFETDNFVRAKDSVHCTGIVNRTDDGRAYTSKEFGECLDMIISRGAIRNVDFIVTLYGNEEKAFHIAIHTTNKFISVEDGEGMVYSEQ